MTARWCLTTSRVALLYVSGLLLAVQVTGIVWTSIEGANPLWPALGAFAMLLLSIGKVLNCKAMDPPESSSGDPDERPRRA